MTHLSDIHPLKSRIGDFIAGLQALEKDLITTDRVSQFLTQMQPSAEALAPYLFWNPSRHARNLIYRDEFFEVLALCWLPGQQTPIHSHNGQLGWMTMAQGELVCRNYRFLRSLDSKELPARTGDHSRLPVKPVRVELLGSATSSADGRVAVVDRQNTTHQIENLEKSPCGSISLHIYSRPIDACVVFDASSQCCERRPLQYYSANGLLLTNEPGESIRTP